MRIAVRARAVIRMGIAVRARMRIRIAVRTRTARDQACDCNENYM